jgi:hypothetical protein
MLTNRKPSDLFAIGLQNKGMKNFTTLILLLITSLATAQTIGPSNSFSVDDLCLAKVNAGSRNDKESISSYRINNEDMLLLENGFCQEYISSKEIPTNNPNNKWTIRFYMSHSFTNYFNTDVSFKSTRYNIEVKDYEWAERSSRHYFLPKTLQEPGNNPFKLIDEPSNTFVLSIEKNGHEFFLSTFHPKYLQNIDQIVYMKGEIDGTPVDGFAPINKPFDTWDQVPGESEIVRNENTHKQMTFEAGYNYRFKILKTKFGNITYAPGLGFGLMVGQNYSSVIQPGEWWEFDGYVDDYGYQGYGVALTNRIEFKTPNDRFGIFYENKIAYYKLEHGFLDGSQKYNLGYMGNSFGMKFKIYSLKTKKPKALSIL